MTKIRYSFLCLV